MYRGNRPQIGLYPLATVACCGAPVGLHLLVHGIVGCIAAIGRRNGYRLLIVQQHPSGKCRIHFARTVFFITESRQKMRIVSESGAAPHHIIPVKSGRPDTNPSFKIIFNRQHNRAHMPVLIVVVFECCTMSCSPGKASQLHAQRIGLLGIKTQWTIGYSHPIGITTELGTRSAILQIIFVVVFGDPGAFHEWIKKGIVHMFPKPLPTIPPGL